MKRFLCTTAFMIALAMLFISGPGQSLTAETNAIASGNEPIKVLAVNLNANSQANWLEGLELQIENTSGKTINYLLLHVDVAGTKIRVPMKFGQPLGAKTSEAPGCRVMARRGHIVRVLGVCPWLTFATDTHG